MNLKVCFRAATARKRRFFRSLTVVARISECHSGHSCLFIPRRVGLFWSEKAAGKNRAEPAIAVDVKAGTRVGVAVDGDKAEAVKIFAGKKKKKKDI